MAPAVALPVSILLGPTVSGKTSLSLELAKRAGAEVVSADSMQIYRGMDIGTAKPSLEDRKRVPHHLLDICEPWETFSVADFVRRADAVVREALGRGRPILMTGGSALYLKGFVEGIFEGPGASEDIRRRLTEESRQIGVPALHQHLVELDPDASRRIHPNDLRRIIRALEVRELTGIPISRWQRQEGKTREGYRFRIYGLSIPRAELYRRIDRRVEHMLEHGLLEETRQLMAHGHGISSVALQALGYREIVAHLQGLMDYATTVDEIKKGTRHFAKRQISWFKRFANVQWLELDGSEKPSDLAEKLVTGFFG